MTRVTRHQRHKKKLIYGFRGASSLLFKKANQQYLHAFQNAFRDRRLRKRFYRTLWMNRMNAHFRQSGFNYSKAMQKRCKSDAKAMSKHPKTSQNIPKHQSETSKDKHGKMNRKMISQLSLFG